MANLTIKQFGTVVFDYNVPMGRVNEILNQFIRLNPYKYTAFVTQCGKIVQKWEGVAR